MNHVTRRRFLQTLGLGAGASILMPISDRLITHAMGVERPVAKRLVLMNVYMITTPIYQPADAQFPKNDSAVAPLVTAAWPETLSPLASYHNRLVVVDGLRNHIGGCQHRSGTSALSCVNPKEGIPEKMGPAGKLTIDQHIANTLSRESAHKSVLWGLTEAQFKGRQKTGSGLFAAGPGQNLSHYTHAGEMLDRLFPDPQMPQVAKANSFRPLRDRLVGDLERLRGRLAAEERLRLEEYEKVILEFDKRQEALSMLSCASPPALDKVTNSQDFLASMMSQSILALQCGLTNVVAISIGHDHNHNIHMPNYREVVERSSDPEARKKGSVPTYGHGSSEARYEAIRNFHQIHMTELARLLDALGQLEESDGSKTLDHTAVVYSAGNGCGSGESATHHGSKDGIWPVMLVAGEKTGFKTGSRYMSCSRHQYKGERWALSDVYKAVSQGLGVDPKGFGDEKNSQGPFSPILA